MADDVGALRVFIDEQQSWLDTVLNTLGWSRESLKNGQPCLLMQCPYNENHYITKSSIDRHRVKCVHGVKEEEEEEVTTEGQKSGTFVSINSEIVQAVKKYAVTTTNSTDSAVERTKPRRDKIDQSEVLVESHDTIATRSLESQTLTPPDLLAQGHTHILRYIKSWPVVPADFVKISSASLNPVEVKAWLFNHLPEKHSYSSQLGGEIQAVETIVRALTNQPSITPDSLISKLSSLFSQSTVRWFVLSLWKFLHTATLQRKYTILGSEVEELTPLPPSSVAFLKNEGASDNNDEAVEVNTFAGKIQALVESEGTRSPLPPLPMDSVPHILNPLERGLLYDYIIEVGGKVTGSGSRDPSLFRDDAAVIKAKLKQQAREESQREVEEEDRDRKKSAYQMKKDRDYKRRRQKYRARNVHITQRTPAQVMRDIINARMAEISSHTLSTNTEEIKLSQSQPLPPRHEDNDYDDKKKELEKQRSRDTAEPSGTKLSESKERGKRHNSRSSYKTSEMQEQGTRERTRRSRSRERLRRSTSRDRPMRKRHSHRSRSGERKRKRSPSTSRGRSKERGNKRSRSTSRSRQHSRERHSTKKKKSKDKERKREK